MGGAIQTPWGTTTETRKSGVEPSNDPSNCDYLHLPHLVTPRPPSCHHGQAPLTSKCLKFALQRSNCELVKPSRSARVSMINVTTGKSKVATPGRSSEIQSACYLCPKSQDLSRLLQLLHSYGKNNMFVYLYMYITSYSKLFQ